MQSILNTRIKNCTTAQALVIFKKCEAALANATSYGHNNNDTSELVFKNNVVTLYGIDNDDEYTEAEVAEGVREAVMYDNVLDAAIYYVYYIYSYAADDAWAEINEDLLVDITVKEHIMLELGQMVCDELATQAYKLIINA